MPPRPARTTVRLAARDPHFSSSSWLRVRASEIVREGGAAQGRAGGASSPRGGRGLANSLRCRKMFPAMLLRRARTRDRHFATLPADGLPEGHPRQRVGQTIGAGGPTDPTQVAIMQAAARTVC